MSISATNSENQETNQDFVQVTPQLLDSTKQAQARANIGALAKEDVSNLIQHVELNADKNLQLKFADGSVQVISLSELLLNRLQLKGVVDTYADLASIANPKPNDAYQVAADNLVYIYTMSGFQTEGKGFDISLDPSGKVEAGDFRAVNGNEVFEAVNNPAGKVLSGDNRPVSGGEVFNKYTPFISEGSELISFTLRKGEIYVDGTFNTSNNWLRTDYIDCNDDNNYTIEGLGVNAGVSGKRIACYNDNGFIGFITQTPSASLFTFKPIENSTKFVIQVQSGANVGANLTTSPFLDTLKITVGTELINPHIIAETIQGNIETEQIKNIEGIANKLENFIVKRYYPQSITTTIGALTTSGVTAAIDSYIRTSVTNANSMASYDNNKKYAYTGEIERNGFAGVVYKDSSLNTLGVECTEIKNYVNHKLTPPENTAYIATCSYLTSPVISEIVETIDSNQSLDNTVYVNGNYSGDDSDGSVNKPFKTITEAINNNKNKSTQFIIAQGDYRETLPWNLLEKGLFSFKTKVAHKVRILGSKKIELFTKTTGYSNVYECNFTDNLISGSRFGKLIFEDGNPSRPITNNERHPLQKSLSYRLPFTEIKEKTSIADVDATAGTFYQDAVNGKLYLHTSNSDNPNENGFSYEYINRNWVTPLAVHTNNNVSIELHNLQFYFGNGSLRFQGFKDVLRKNITALATTSAGCFMDDTSNIVSFFDEAGFCNGDGINGHFSAYGNYQDLTDHRSMQPSAMYFEPWCHDNFDDGMSHHENHFVIVKGCLIEYNDDGGIRASNDSGYIIHNPYCRKNGLITGAGEGIAVVNPNINGNRNGCKAVVYGGIVEGNAYGLAAISDSRNILEVIGTICRNNINGELYASYGKVISRNLRATNLDPNKKKVTSNSGIIEVLNDEILN